MSLGGIVDLAWTLEVDIDMGAAHPNKSKAIPFYEAVSSSDFLLQRFFSRMNLRSQCPLSSSPALELTVHCIEQFLEPHRVNVTSSHSPSSMRAPLVSL